MCDLLTPLHCWFYVLASCFLWWGSWAASMHLGLTFLKPLLKKKSDSCIRYRRFILILFAAAA
jgi:hypothetical protein